MVSVKAEKHMMLQHMEKYLDLNKKLTYFFQSSETLSLYNRGLKTEEGLAYILSSPCHLL